MDLKSKSTKCISFMLAVSLIFCSEVFTFDFPGNLEGLNRSTFDVLNPYMIYSPVNLGLDVLDDYVPLKLRAALSKATCSKDISLNQYAPSDGHPRLRKAIAKLYSKLINREVTPENNVVVTLGATGGVYSAFHGHTEPGDEWIVIEPAFTMFVPIIKMARGVPRFTTLKSTKFSGEITGDDYVLNNEEMEGLINEKTKGILINTPLNPIGKVYTLEELTFIANLAKKYDLIIISDEAHEWVTYKPHIRIASLPGMFERTITIGSASKTFSVAGWRIGWAYGHANVLNQLKIVNSKSTSGSATPQQEALAIIFEEEYEKFGKPKSYFVSHLKDVRKKRDYIVKTFKDVGMAPIVPEGGYCMLAKWTSLKGRPLIEADGNSALNFVKWLIKNIGVFGLPGADYFSKEHRYLGDEYVRYCFHKKDETLKKAAKRFQKLKDY